MPETIVKLNRKQAEKLLSVSFPDYNGRKIKMVFRDTVHFYDTNWSGGTRNQYSFIRADGDHKMLEVPAPWDNVVEGKSVNLPADVIVACHTIFCGKDLGITFYANPCWLPKWLPEGQNA